MGVFLQSGGEAEGSLRPEITKALSDNELMMIERQDGKKVIPAYIFCQNGTIRETWTTNQGKWTLAKVDSSLGTYDVASDYLSVKWVKATNKSETSVTSYTNGYMQNQGIGSRSTDI